MKTMNKFILAMVILLMVGLGTLSAADSNAQNATSVSTDTSLSGDIADSSTQETISNVKTTKSNDDADSSTDKTISNVKTTKNNNVETTSKSIKKEDNTDMEVESSSETTNKVLNTTKSLKTDSITITSDNYDQYWVFDKKENRTVSTSLISEGDVLNLQGTFKNVNFTIDKQYITITSLNKNARLYNCTVNVHGIESSNSVIENLTSENNNWYGSGIYVNITNNLTIRNNSMHVWGPFAFALAADGMNNSLVINNTFETKCREDIVRTHTACAFGKCYYNNIVYNRVISDDANGIYFSLWGSGLFQGGYCDYNYVGYNYVTGDDEKNTTSWCYTIQIMGTGNVIDSNTVRYGYRGISTQDFTNNTIINNYVNGSAQGIYACEGAVVVNNTVLVNGTTTAIEVGGEGALIENNTVHSNYGDCLRISASKCTVRGNSFTSTDGYGIYSKGKYTDIIIENNEIDSKKAGIIFKKQSSTKKINYANVTNNIIKSQAEYAIDFSEAGAKNEADVHIYVGEDNVLECKNGRGIDIAYAPPSVGGGDNLPDSNKTYVVTQDTYYTYFTDENVINTNKVLKNDTIILKGDFSGLDFTFTIKTHVIGQDCVIRNGTITFSEDASASTLTNVTIINYDENSLNRNGIRLMEVNNCNITNVKVSNYDEWESFGILLFSSSGNDITNNTIFTSGDYVNYGIFAYASDLNYINNNKVTLNQSSKPLEYDDEIMFEDSIGTIKEILHNYGILLVYSSDNQVDSNVVTATSQFKEYQFPVEECKNSIVGIDVYYDSNYNTITRNNISVTSYGPYSYGMGVLGAPWGTSITSLNATNNTFKYNNVKVNGGYFATGFIAGLNSVNTTVEDNYFEVNALHNETVKGDYTYGLTLESCLNTIFVNNTMKATGASLYSVELFGTTGNVIANNTFYGEATNPYGIAGYQSSDNIISGNTITLRSMEYGNTSSALHSDSIPYGKEAIMFMQESYRNNITTNTININSTDYAVKLTSKAVNNTVFNNSIVSPTHIGDDAVDNQHKSNIVSCNFVYFTNATMGDTYGTVGNKITLTAIVTSTSADTSNLTAKFTIGNTEMGVSKVENGIATLQLNQTQYLKPTVYTVTVFVSGTNFQNATATASLVLNKTKDDSVVTVSKVNDVIGSKVTINADVTSTSGSKLTGNVTFLVGGAEIGTVNLTLGKASITYQIPANAQSEVLTVVAIYNGNDDYNGATGTSTLGIQSKTVTSVSSASAKIGHTVTLTAKVTSNGQAVTKGKVVFKLNGKTIGTVSVSKGVATYKYTIPTNTVSKTYTITAKYGGNDTLASSSAENTLTINKLESKLLYNTTTSRIGDNTTLTIKVTNTTSGQYATSGNMTLTINNEILKHTNGSVIYGYVNSKGNVIFTFTAPSTLQGSNNITFKYNGNNQFLSSSATFTNGLVITDKYNTKIKEITVTKNTTINTTFKVTVKSGSNYVQSGQVQVTDLTLNVSSKATVKNGVAYVTIALNKTATNRKFSIKYLGNSVYNPSSTETRKLNVTKVNTNIKVETTKNNAVNTTFKVTVKTGSANVLSGQVQVTDQTTKKTYKATVKNGIAYITIALNKTATNRKFTIKYLGDSTYNPSSSTTKTLNITKAGTNIKVQVLSSKTKNVTLKATVKSGDYLYVTKGTVQVLNNNKVIASGTVSKGVSTIKLSLSAGTYSLTMKYVSNDIYNTASKSTSVKVTA